MRNTFSSKKKLIKNSQVLKGKNRICLFIVCACTCMFVHAQIYRIVWIVFSRKFSLERTNEQTKTKQQFHWKYCNFHRKEWSKKQIQTQNDSNWIFINWIICYHFDDFESTRFVVIKSFEKQTSTMFKLGLKMPILN